MKMCLLFLLLLSSFLLQGKPENREERSIYILKLKRPVALEALRREWGVHRVERFFPIRQGYFSKLVQVHATSREVREIQGDPSVLSVERPGVAKILGLDSKESRRITSDPFSNYQWALHVDRQEVYEDLDDIHPRSLQPNQRASIGWSLDTLEGLHARLQKRPVVAVIDGGVDVDHEDLKGVFYKNEIECEGNGRPQIGEGEDRDGNGFAGDCLGWDFTVESQSFARVVRDENGHGTLIAGILSARVENGKGVLGISDQIQILPIKVYGREERKKKTEVIGPVTDRIAKGILYATNRGVDVIALSLGWPKSADSEFLREAFRYARKKGVVFVAAAGNDDSETQIFPCAYSQVICVGAHAIDGKKASYSNYGLHVDFTAPGDHILSTFPMNGLQQVYFGPRGYEVANGTSFSAPHIAALAALIKGIQPNAKFFEVYRELLLSAERVQDWKTNPRLDRLFQNPESKLPVLIKNKEVTQVAFDGKSGSFAFPLHLYNFNRERAHVKIDIKSLNPGVFIQTQEVLELAPLSGEEFEVRGRVLDLTAESRTQVGVTVSSGGFKTESQFHFDLMVGEQESFDLEIPKSDFENQRGGLRSLWRFPRAETYPRFSFSTQEGGAEWLHLIEVPNFQDIKVSKKRLDPGEQVLSRHIVDLNFDGRDDVLLRTFVQGEEDSRLFYHFLSGDLTPLFPGVKKLELDFEGVLLPGDNRKIRFVKRRVEGLGEVAIPLFLAGGYTPKRDQNPNFFDFEENVKRRRLFFLEPAWSEERQNFEMQTRIYRDYQLEKRLKETLNLRFQHEVSVLSLFPQTEEEFEEGRVTILWSYGRTDSKTYLTSELSDPELRERSIDFSDFDSRGFLLETSVNPSTINLDSESFVSKTSAFYTLFQQNLGRVVTANRQGTSLTLTLREGELSNSIGGLLSFYSGGDTSYVFYESVSGLHAFQIQRGKGQEKFSRRVSRTSFYPGFQFSLNFFPLRYRDGKSWKPIIYVDSTHFSGNHLSFWTLEDGKIKSPIGLSQEVPKGCQSLNPTYIEGRPHFVLFCKEEGVIKLIQTRLLLGKGRE